MFILPINLIFNKTSFDIENIKPINNFEFFVINKQ
jgi:hypothetical protein